MTSVRSMVYGPDERELLSKTWRKGILLLSPALRSTLTMYTTDVSYSLRYDFYSPYNDRCNIYHYVHPNTRVIVT